MVLLVIARGHVRWTARMIANAALCLALAFVLSYIKLFDLPQGGAVTAASLLPIIAFAYSYAWLEQLTQPARPQVTPPPQTIHVLPTIEEMEKKERQAASHPWMRLLAREVDVSIYSLLRGRNRDRKRRMKAPL